MNVLPTLGEEEGVKRGGKSDGSDGRGVKTEIPQSSWE